MTNISLAIFTAVQLSVASIVSRVREERGQDTLEWALLCGLIAIALLLGFVLFRNSLLALVKGIGNCIDFTLTTLCDPGP